MRLCKLGHGIAQVVFSAFFSVELGIAAIVYPSTARADSPAQARAAIQAICNHTATSDAHRDLAGFMAQYSPDLTVRNVVGGRQNFRQLKAAKAKSFARDNYRGSGHCTFGQVVLKGNQAHVVLHWHYISHFQRTATSPGYTIVRDYEEQTIWTKSAVGWQETSADVTRDVLDYRR